MELKRLIEDEIIDNLNHFPVVAILGSRQIGKTTLVKKITKKHEENFIYLDLESPRDLLKLTDAETFFIEREDKTIVIDEIQRNLSLFPILRSVIDRNRKNGRFILLGSASPTLLAKSSETLAGRICFFEMEPLKFEEVRRHYDLIEYWLKGGYPDFLQTKSVELSIQKRIQFIQTYVERDLPLLGLSISNTIVQNCLYMLAHMNGSTLNLSNLSKSLGKDINSIKTIINYFENAYLIKILQPFYFNLNKRIVKSPKVYLCDTGLLHAILQIENKEELDGHPIKGFSWEGLVISEIMTHLHHSISCYFYRTQDGSELDLVLVKGLKPILGIEIKVSNSPNLSRGTTIASQDLGNIPIWVICPNTGEKYKYNKIATVISFENVLTELKEIGLSS